MNFDQFVDSLAVDAALDQFGVPWLLLNHNGRLRPFNLMSPRDLMSFLRTRYVAEAQRLPTKAELNHCIERFGWQAETNTTRLSRSVRVAGCRNGIEIDLGDDAGRAIKITASTVTVDQPSRIFVRSKGIQALPEPELEPLTIEQAETLQVELCRCLNLAPDDGKLLIGFLVGAFVPWGPAPILYIRGPEASGKTTLSDAIRMFIDPNEAAHSPLHGGFEKLLMDATWSHLQVYDNLSLTVFSRRYSDYLAQISTGTGIRCKSVGSSGGEQVIVVKKPIVLNGIDEFVIQADLQSRVAKLDMPPLTGRRVSSERIRSRLEALAPQVMTLIAHSLRRVLEVGGSFEVDTSARQVSWVEVMAACEESLGWSPGTFQGVLERNLERAQIDRHSDNPFVLALVEFIGARESWEGTATQLAEVLAGAVTPQAAKWKELPRGPRAISVALNREEASLRFHGIRLERTRDAEMRRIVLINERFFPGDRVASDAMTMPSAEENYRSFQTHSYAGDCAGGSHVGA